ncbi:MAG: pyridoxamine 5'-phosphate oxidase family protein [Candidatus Thorarchaeota archaeon]|jgi:nitroimidazol reductase NimA-like FMN-containing flavoprotein (pyridoxamine 5'-phosphate oxidase superfamily)
MTLSDRGFSFDFIEKEVRKKTFGVLSAVDSKGRPHSTGILYGVSPPDSKFALYILTEEGYAKVRHIKRNPNISLVVTFPHYYIRFAPAGYVMFRGTAELVPFNDSEAQWAFSQKRILRMAQDVDPEILKKAVFIKMNPEPTVFCYAVGIGIMQLRKEHIASDYKVKIPADRQ